MLFDNQNEYPQPEEYGIVFLFHEKMFSFIFTTVPILIGLTCYKYKNIEFYRINFRFNEDCTCNLSYLYILYKNNGFNMRASA